MNPLLITPTEAVILRALADSGSRALYGLEMVKASEGALKLGTIYVLLSRLEEKGYVTSERETSAVRAVPRRMYRLAGDGSRVLHAYEAAMAAHAGFGLGVQA